MMNDELPHTNEQLRVATTRSLPPSTQLDSETAAARESFLSLGSAIESASGTFDESALLARLNKSCLESPVVPLKPSQSKRDWLSLLLTGALAAAALVAIVRIANEPSGTGQPVAAIKWSPALIETGGIRTPEQLVLAWNDTLDDEIALASATLQQYSTRNRGFDGSLLDMNDRLEALSQELSNDTL